ncbi:uncharacterized protein LOC135156326 [Lytechinus pictus]|uniref:uncharacterized protein LOC135156326 n=1 Tax=Lytechinus pictus TaxID=7653 RepID=UPI0030B9D6CF
MFDARNGYHGTMPDDINLIRKRLQAKYTRQCRHVRSSAVDPDSSKRLLDVFVSLVMVVTTTTSFCKKETSIEMEGLYKLIKREAEIGVLTRFAFLGKVGVGKSTLFSMIALNWALGNCLQHIDLLFLESFRNLEKRKFFGEIVLSRFPDLKRIDGGEIDEYIENNPERVMIMLVDLDLKTMDLRHSDNENSIVSIVRGERFMNTPVLITTFPYVTDLIKSNDDIRQLYTLIEVKGFSKEGANTYINNFFHSNKQLATDLLKFIRSNDLISEHLTPFPIFCSILCNVWEKSRDVETKAFETFSLVFKEICFSLVDQYILKQHYDDEEYKTAMKQVSNVVSVIGKVAFDGLIRDEHLLTEEKMAQHKEEATTACAIGILGKERVLASRKSRQAGGDQFVEQFYFPHKLWQEYTASCHLECMFRKDYPEFNRILDDHVLGHYKKFTYVLYFAASLGGEVGKSLMEALCRRVHDMRFIINVAFECHEEGALAPIKDLLLRKRTIVSDHSDQHSLSATVFALESFGKEVLEEVKHISADSQSEETRMYSDDRISQYAKALFDMPNLRSLQLGDPYLEDGDFFSNMATKARKSQITTIKYGGGRLLDQDSAKHFSEAIVSFPNLQNLELCDLELSSSKDFYVKLAQGASQSKIESLKHEGGSTLDPTASAKYAEAIVTMPHLQTLDLSDVKLDDEFYPKLAEGASKSRIVTLKHERGKLGEVASSRYSDAIMSMPCLQELEISNMTLNDDFYKPMATRASNTKIKKLKHTGGILGQEASSNYGKCLSSMPDLQSLELEKVKLHDDFYKTASTEGSKSKIEVLRHAVAELNDVASSHYGQSLFSLPNLRSLEIERVKLSSGFFSTMSKKAPMSEITSLRHVEATLTSVSSYNYAKGLFSMPKLQSVELIRIELSDEFFTTMSDHDHASNSKIEKLKLSEAKLSKNASAHFGKGLCAMPRLQLLELHSVELQDESATTLLGEASRPKVHTMVMKRCTINERILRAILSFPQLQSLCLDHNIGFPANTEERKPMKRVASSVNDLSVDCGSVAALWELQLPTSCSKVKKLTVFFYDEDLDSSIIITTACSPFPSLTELHIHWLRSLDPVKFYNALKKSCPRLIKLTLTRIKLYNEKASQVIECCRKHPTLKFIEMDSCSTDGYLDAEIIKVNNERKLTVNVTHGPEDMHEDNE